MRNAEFHRILFYRIFDPDNIISYVLAHNKGTKINQQNVKDPVKSSKQNQFLYKVNQRKKLRKTHYVETVENILRKVTSQLVRPGTEPVLTLVPKVTSQTL